MTVKILTEFLKNNRYKSKQSGYKNGWTNNQYKVEGFDSDNEENGNGYVILVNDLNEIWWVINQHVRVVKR